MKKNQSINVWRAIALLVAVFFFFACKPGDSPNDPTNPTDPLVAPVVSIGAATNVTATTASIVAWVIPNESNTTISFEYKNSTETTYHVKTLGTNYSGKDSIKVTFDFSDLVANSDYSVLVRASNKAGNIPSSEVKFSTWVVKDYDGNYYQIIKIGTQTWLKADLKATHYADGTVIPNVTDGVAWYILKTPAYCYYNNDTNLGKTYGALYNWYTATSKTFITGYHLPSADEFTTLQTYLGGVDQAWIKLMDSSGIWKGLTSTPTNSSGFTSLPAGGRSASGGDSYFNNIERNNNFWTSSTGAYNSVFSVIDGLSGTTSKANGNSIRLIKD